MGVHITNNKNETVLLAEQFAKKLKPGNVILFNGGLGCGKTAFCGGIAKGLGIDEIISSPTYSIVNVYEADVKFVHFDFYKINSLSGLEMAGFFDYLAEGAIIAGEWAEKLNEIACKNIKYDYKINMQIIGENERRIEIEGGGII